jgi:glycosyltransferase involved in cell wall biosynthesis
MKKENAKPKPRRKVVVYAICRNEEKFVSRWMDSMKEADEIVVLDTGSRDGTVEKLRSLGAKVETKKYAAWNTVADYRRIIAEGKEPPWRFDSARNDSIDLALRLVPDADVLVCTDLD